MNDREANPLRGEEEIHLLDYIIVLAKYSRMILYTSAAVAGLTLAVLMITPNKFTATARLLPPQQNVTLSGQMLDTMAVSSGPGSSGNKGLGGIAGLFGLKSPGELYVGMLNGDTISDRIIARFNLREVYKQRFIEGARTMLRARGDVKTGKDGLISIDFTDVIPQRAADIANAYVEELDKLQQEIAHHDANNQLSFLEKERGQASINLSQAEDALQSFSEKSSVIQIDSQAKAMIVYITQLRTAIDVKEVQIKVVRQSATPSNYDVIRLETELKGLKDKLREAEVKADQDCVGDVCIATGKMPQLGLEYFRLYREVKYQEAIYQLFTKMVELARIDAARNVVVSTVQFVDKAQPPERKSKPTRLKTAILAGLITFIVMIIVAFGREFWHNTTKSEAAAPRLRELSRYTQPWQQKLHRILVILRLRKN